MFVFVFPRKFREKYYSYFRENFRENENFREMKFREHLLIFA
jgi:hypothetical protein